MMPRPSNRKRPDDGRRRVTLIAGMVCKDGIVMAADSEQSGYFRKSNVPKLESCQADGLAASLGGSQGCSVIIAGAGNGELADYASHKIAQEGKNLYSLHDFETKLEEILADIFGRRFPIYKPDDLGEVRLLIAVKAPDVDIPKLYSSYGSTVVERKKYVLGSGALVDYILDQIYDESMTTEDGVAAALSLLQIAKKYVDGVGGDSKIAFLNNSGRVHTKPAWEVREEEGILAEHSRLTNRLMLAMMRTRTDSEEAWKQNLEQFTKDIEDLRQKKKGSDQRIEELVKYWKQKWDENKRELDKEEAKKLPYLIESPTVNLFKKEGNIFTGHSLPNAKVVGKLSFKNA
jgi:20S proteasome alpha/beta subunit